MSGIFLLSVMNIQSLISFSPMHELCTLVGEVLTVHRNQQIQLAAINPFNIHKLILFHGNNEGLWIVYQMVI